MNWYHSDTKIGVYLIYLDLLDNSFVHNEHLGRSKLFTSTLSWCQIIGEMF